MKRRDFISQSAAIGSGLLVAGTIFAEDKTEEKQTHENAAQPLRVGIVGCGRQGRAIINVGLKIPNMKIAAVCDILLSARRSAKLYLESELEDENAEIAMYADFHELLDKEKGKLDALVIATPDFLHAKQTMDALDAGLHVYCEPMMATNADDARAMIKASNDHSRLLQIGLERRSDPRYRHAMQKLLQSEESRELLLGIITHFETQANRRVHSEMIWAERDTLPDDTLKRYGYESMSQYRNWKQYRKYCNGQCANFFAQQLDVFEWFFKIRPREATASGGLDYYKYGDTFDNTSALLTYVLPKGTVRGVSRVWTTTSAGGSLPFEHIFGENGSLQTSLNDEFFRLYAEPGLAKWNEFLRRGDLTKVNVEKEGEDPNLIKVRETGNVVPYQLPMTRTNSAIQLHLANFVNAAFGSENLNCSGGDAFASHIIAWKLAESADTGKTVSFSDEMFE
ncbi:MAG: Gfo/Idh/MocA family oxidoreductase [Planctomycetaceae bacterium]|jgi:predicted dehydrogenase|nr:Gfo/Idh/MocA family oxidoreductase [Planctomycetaceae bacterium]